MSIGRRHTYRRQSRRWVGKLVRHLEFAVVLVAVGEGDRDNVLARVDDLGYEGVGGPDMTVIDRAAGRGGDLDLDVAQVLCEGHRKEMAVDVSLDGVSPGAALDMGSHYRNLTGSVKRIGYIGKNMCSKQNATEYTNDCFES